MTVKEAIKELENAPNSETKKSRVNPVLTEGQVLNILIRAFAEMKSDDVLDDLLVKRVFQVARNQKRPRFN